MLIVEPGWFRVVKYQSVIHPLENRRVFEQQLLWKLLCQFDANCSADEMGSSAKGNSHQLIVNC